MDDTSKAGGCSRAVDTADVPVALLDAIGRMRRPVLVGHVVPDADALGGMFAFAQALSMEGCHPTVSLPEGSLSQRLAFLHASADVTSATAKNFESADGFIVVDTASLGRCSVGAERASTDWVAGRPLVNVDHHVTNTRFGEVCWVIGDAGSTCELVYTILRASGRPIAPWTASLLFAGLQTDTLRFSLSTTTARVLRVAAELVELGADVGRLGERLYRSLRQSEFDLLRVIYANTAVAAEGRIAFSFATHEEIRGAGCKAADIDDQINVPRCLDGARLAMLFTEGIRGKTRINFRGAGTLSVLELARRFGGGGHGQAAGAVVDGQVREVMNSVVTAAVGYLADR